MEYRYRIGPRSDAWKFAECMRLCNLRAGVRYGFVKTLLRKINGRRKERAHDLALVVMQSGDFYANETPLR